jgi:hypothetical protein
MYVGCPLPTLLALSNEQRVIADLLSAIRHLLPNRFYAHLSPGLEEDTYTRRSSSLHQ